MRLLRKVDPLADVKREFERYSGDRDSLERFDTLTDDGKSWVFHCMVGALMGQIGFRSYGMASMFIDEAVELDASAGAAACDGDVGRSGS